jgi:thioredoxin-like negative regulator of GroEL
MYSTFDNLAATHPNGQFWKVDKMDSLADKYDVSSLPTFVVIQEGKPTRQVVGTNKKKL